MTYLTAQLETRALVAVGGEERTDFLQGLVTNDVTKLTPAMPLYAALLTPQGKVLYDFVLTAQDDVILIDVARADAAALAKRLTMYKLRAKVTISPRDDLHVFACWGTPPLPGLADPRLPALGTRLIADTAVTNVGESDYIAHRLALGVGEGDDIGHEATYPLEANFEPLNGVSFRKGCYVGQELTARMKHKTTLRKRILPVTLTDTASVGAPLTAEGRDVGELLAAQGDRGLALMRLDRLAEAGDAPLQAGGGTARVQWPEWIPR